MPTEYEFLRDTAAHLIRISRASMDIGTARKLREVADTLIARAEEVTPKD